VVNLPSLPDGSDAPPSVLCVPQVPLRILVVEDEDAARSVLEAAVRSLGYECRSACDGREALQMLKTGPADVILSDWSMPRVDGIELCRRIRANASDGGYTYFIFMTGHADKEHFLRGMEAGADDYHTKPVDLDELRVRLVSAGRVIELYRRLASKNNLLRRDSQNALRIARLDALTQVSNRLALDEDLRSLWARVTRYDQRCCIALCDLDQFKAYNDHLGHLAGDACLQRVAKTLRDQLREGDGLYRYGGEEFIVLLPEQALGAGLRAMGRARQAIESAAIATADPDRVVTISIGVAELDLAQDASPQDWLRRADAAMYRAKMSGRNRVEAAEPPRRDA
jgi:two-component system, cell cycle response regulator